MRKQRPTLHVLLPLAALAGCLGYRTPMLDPNADEPTSPTPPSDAGPDLGPKDMRPDFGPDLARNDALLASVCQAKKRYVLLLGGDGQLYRFETDTLALTSLDAVSCGSDDLNSMTVSPIGPAYISSQSGDLCLVDTRTFKATRTAFDPIGVLYRSYGMALLPDNVPAGQTLYIAMSENTNVNHLKRIDLSTFVLTSIGDIAPAVPWAELTAGPSGELYGFAVGQTESLLLNIDPKTATAIDVTKVPDGFGEGAFALVYWQDAFYLFLGDAYASSSTVYHYRKGDNQVTTLGALDASIIGAGVACASD